MKNAVIAVVCLIAIAAAGFASLHSMRGLRSPVVQSAQLLPGKFGDVRVGLTTQQVTALVGAPKSRSVNARFENKTPQEWAKIRAQVDSETASTAASAAPNPQLLRLGAELEHRVKQIWHYEPTPTTYVMVSFDGSGHVIQTFSGEAHSGGQKK